jgi:hypothetical protein
VKNARGLLMRLAVLVATCSAAFGAYTYYYTDSLTSINTTNWTQNGTLTAGSGGLTSSDTNGGSLIFVSPARLRQRERGLHFVVAASVRYGDLE